MFPLKETVIAFGIALVNVVPTSFAGDNKAILIKGTVIGDNGKPCDGVEIRLLRVDAKGRETRTVTNGRGQYWLYGLPPGAYTVTAYFQGFARSRANIKTAGVGWAKVDFDLRLDKGAGDSVDQMREICGRSVS
jgi:hypothetical protein